MNVSMQFEALSRLVGNTPLLTVHYTYRGRPGVIHAKSENLNMTGSVKDRMALHILEYRSRGSDGRWGTRARSSSRTG